MDEKALKDICDTIKLNDATNNNEDLMELEDYLLFSLPKLWIFANKTFYAFKLDH